MVLIACVFTCLLFYQDEIPLKPKDEFELRLNFTFKKRPPVDNTTINFEETRAEHDRRMQGGELPFVKVAVKFTELNERELRMKVVTSSRRQLMAKKIFVDDEYEFDLGFTDDLKDHVGDHEFNILLMDKKKNEVSRIHLFITDDGNFLVNDEKRGKF